MQYNKYVYVKNGHIWSHMLITCSSLFIYIYTWLFLKFSPTPLKNIENYYKFNYQGFFFLLIYRFFNGRNKGITIRMQKKFIKSVIN